MTTTVTRQPALCWPPREQLQPQREAPVGSVRSGPSLPHFAEISAGLAVPAMALQWAAKGPGKGRSPQMAVTALVSAEDPRSPTLSSASSCSTLPPMTADNASAGTSIPTLLPPKQTPPPPPSYSLPLLSPSLMQPFQSLQSPLRPSPFLHAGPSPKFNYFPHNVFIAPTDASSRAVTLADRAPPPTLVLQDRHPLATVAGSDQYPPPPTFASPDKPPPPVSYQVKPQLAPIPTFQEKPPLAPTPRPRKRKNSAQPPPEPSPDGYGAPLANLASRRKPQRAAAPIAGMLNVVSLMEAAAAGVELGAPPPPEVADLGAEYDGAWGSRQPTPKKARTRKLKGETPGKRQKKNDDDDAASNVSGVTPVAPATVTAAKEKKPRQPAAKRRKSAPANQQGPPPPPPPPSAHPQPVVAAPPPEPVELRRAGWGGGVTTKARPPPPAPLRSSSPPSPNEGTRPQSPLMIPPLMPRNHLAEFRPPAAWAQAASSKDIEPRSAFSEEDLRRIREECEEVKRQIAAAEERIGEVRERMSEPLPKPAFDAFAVSSDDVEGAEEAMQRYQRMMVTEELIGDIAALEEEIVQKQWAIDHPEIKSQYVIRGELALQVAEEIEHYRRAMPVITRQVEEVKEEERWLKEEVAEVKKSIESIQVLRDAWRALYGNADEARKIIIPKMKEYLELLHDGQWKIRTRLSMFAKDHFPTSKFMEPGEVDDVKDLNFPMLIRKIWEQNEDFVEKKSATPWYEIENKIHQRMVDFFVRAQIVERHPTGPNLVKVFDFNESEFEFAKDWIGEEGEERVGEVGAGVVVEEVLEGDGGA
ncbi:hypothetical protein HK101_003550 [Irineochytrium annulatum]|nr:hypothetical protein HK101_003550 [Irineochytrium annulatum]